MLSRRRRFAVRHRLQPRPRKRRDRAEASAGGTESRSAGNQNFSASVPRGKLASSRLESISTLATLSLCRLTQLLTASSQGGDIDAACLCSSPPVVNQRSG